MWKICLLLSLVGAAVTTTTEEKTVSGIPWPPKPWPPVLPAKLIFPFLPQIPIAVQDDKIVLLLIDVVLDGIHTCDFKKYWFSEFDCTNITLRSDFKAGGGVFNLPIVGKGTISLDIGMHVTPLNVKTDKLIVTFTKFKFVIDGLDPGSDMGYLANGFANSLQLDLEQAIVVIVNKVLAGSNVDIECGAENIERLRETLLAEDTYEKYMNVLNEPSETAGESSETGKTKSSETEASLNLKNTMQCVEGIISAKLSESEMLQWGDSPHATKQLLAFSKTLGDGLQALFNLYTPETDL